MRVLRDNVAGDVYHLIWRFVDRDWFFQDAVERRRYLTLLGRALSKSDWRCLAYALMSNHIHMAVVAGSTPMDAWSRRVNPPFAWWMNQRRGRLGPLFAARAKDFAVRPDAEGALIAYIHNNPVRAGVVARAADCPWTSHPDYVGRREPPSWLHVDEGMRRAGCTDRGQFDRWVGQSELDLDPAALAAIKRAARRRGALELATPTRTSPSAFPVRRRPFGALHGDPAYLLGLVCEIVDVGPHLVCSRRRSPPIVRARSILVHAGLSAGIAASDLAATLGLSATAVTKLGRRDLTERDRRRADVVAAQVVEQASLECAQSFRTWERMVLRR
jgi:hypothetical protein